MDPTAFDNPVVGLEFSLMEEKKREKGTTDNDDKNRKAFVPAHEHVQHNARPTAFDHSSEQWRPSLCEGRPDVCVAQCECEARHADSDDKHAVDEKDGSE